MKDRIRKLLLSEGLTSGAFADEIGVQRSSLSHILNGRNNPSLDFVVKTKNRFPKLNLAWLIMGEGGMYNTEELLDSTSDIPMTNSINLLQAFTEAADESAVSKNIEDSDHVIVKEGSNERQVSQVLIFYNDMTFQSYNPRK